MKFVDSRHLLRRKGDRVVEVLVLLGLLFLLIFTAVKTIRVGSAVPELRDLEFSGTSVAFADLVRDWDPDSVATIAAGSPDTIAYASDSTDIPSLKKGGYLRDQLEQLNTDIIRASVLSDSASLSSLSTSSVIQFRTDENGDIETSPILNRFALRVGYSLNEDIGQRVLASNAGEFPALVGVRGFLGLGTLRERPDSSRLFNGRACATFSGKPRVLVYCRTQSASNVGRHFDLGVRLSRSRGVLSAEIGLERRRRSFIDGQPVTLGIKKIPVNSVIETPQLGSFIVSDVHDGVIAERQWVNGKFAYQTHARGTLSFFGRARSNSGLARAPGGVLRTSLDSDLTSDLDERIRIFGSTSHAGIKLSRAAVLVADIRSGEVKAISEYRRDGSNGKPLTSFEPMLLGSLIKPILASAILSRAPSLASLKVPYGGNLISEVHGVRLAKGFANDPNGCSIEVLFDLTRFIQCSNNQYAAELVMRSMDIAAGRGRTVEDGVIPRRVVEKSPLADGLALAFGVSLDSRTDSLRVQSAWADTAAGSEALVSDGSLFPHQSRPWIMPPKADAGPSPDMLARYAFGAWENRWTMFGVAEAFARIATGRPTSLGFLQRTDSARSFSFPHFASAISTAFAYVRPGMMAVADDGTAGGLRQALLGALKLGPGFTILAKTGTLNEGAGEISEGRIQMKSLGFVVGKRVNDNTSEMRCGLVAVSFFEFERVPEGAKLPRVHLEFAQGEMARALAAHWSRRAPC